MAPSLDFIREQITTDVEAGKVDGKVITRFPPEPNGYLHIGHAKSICLNFGVAAEFGGRCHLRFDDTNPTREEQHFVDAIRRDIRWLGFEWGEHEYFASDYYQRLYLLPSKTPRPDLMPFVNNLIDAVTAQLSSPASDATLRECNQPRGKTASAAP